MTISSQSCSRACRSSTSRARGSRSAPPEPGHPGDGEPEPLGVLAGDNQGWPNGRRLGDDVIDIAEQAVAGFLKGTKVPLGDGVNGDDRNLLGSFPYIADPQSGFDNTKGK